MTNNVDNSQHDVGCHCQYGILLTESVFNYFDCSYHKYYYYSACCSVSTSVRFPVLATSVVVSSFSPASLVLLRLSFRFCSFMTSSTNRANRHGFSVFFVAQKKKYLPAALDVEFFFFTLLIREAFPQKHFGASCAFTHFWYFCASSMSDLDGSTPGTGVWSLVFCRFFRLILFFSGHSVNMKQEGRSAMS